MTRALARGARRLPTATPGGYCAAMSALLAATLPFFLLVALGALAARLRLLPVTALPGLQAFTLYFALPALLFRLGAGGAFHHLGLASLGVYGAAALGLLAVVQPPLRRRCGHRVAGFAALATAFPNSGFLGLPLLLGLLGPDAAGPVAATLLVDVFLTSSLCLWLAHRGPQGARGAGPRPGALAALRPVWLNPLPWAIAAGAVADLVATRWGWVPAGPVDRVLAMVGAAATPVALFALGALLVAASAGHPAVPPPPAGRRAGRATAASPASSSAPSPAPPLPLGPLLAAKLLLHPALVLALAPVARALGLPLSPAAADALLLTAALPCASNVVLLADRHGGNAPALARLVVASTVAALPVFLLWARWATGH